MPDIDYGELFGVELSDGGNAGAQEDAANAGAAETPGSETDSAGTAEKSTEGSGDPEKSPDGRQAVSDSDDDGGAENAGLKNGEAPAATGAQSAEENARYAAARRRAERERDEAIARAKADMQKEMDEVFASSGMVNPYTKQPIRSRAEYDEYRKRFDEEQKSRVMRKSGMSDDEFNKFVESLPQVREAKQAAQEARAAQEQAREREAKARIDEQIREIGAMDPAIQSISDLTKMENYDKFYELVKRGNSLTDAYKLVNFDRLTSRTAAAGRQAAINSAAGKAHMGRTSSRGQGAVTVPPDVMEQYRVFLPDATDAEIQAHYQRYHKK